MTRSKGKAKPKMPESARLILPWADYAMATIAAALDLRKPGAIGMAMAQLARERDGEARQRRQEAKHRLTYDLLMGGASVLAQCHAVQAVRPKMDLAAGMAAIHARRADALDRAIETYRNVALTWREDEGPTPEHHAKPSRERDAIRTLEQNGRLSAHQGETARRIAWVYHGIVAGLMPRARNHDSAGRPPGFAWTGGEPAYSVANEHERVYKPWIRRLRRKGVPLSLVIDVVVDSVALDAAARDHRMGHERALKLLRLALDLYAEARQRPARRLGSA